MGAISKQVRDVLVKSLVLYYKLVVPSASLVVTSALLVATRSY